MIKRILCGLAVAASFSACTEDFKDWADPQSNPQPETVAFGNGSVSEVGLIDFANLEDGQTAIKVCDIQAPSASDTNYKPEYTISLGGESFALAADGTMSVSDLIAYIEAQYGKAPYERTITSTVSMWLNNGVQTIKTATSDVFSVKAKLVAPHISDNYYVVGGTLDWAASAASKELKFQHSAQNVYDDPIFTITIEAAEGADTWFAIGDDEALDAVGNGDWSKLLGTTGASQDLEGMLKPRYELGADQSLCVEAKHGAKFIKIELNMMDGTYKITPLSFSSFFYEIGNDSGWSTPNALYGPANDGIYQGYYYLDGEFKFKPNKDDWAGDYEYAGDGHIADNGGSNCPAPNPAGFYQIDVDLQTGTYALTQVKSITVVGNFNGWNQADANTHMTYNREAGCWEATLKLTDNGFKFAMNDAWDISWGGANGDASSYGNLTQLGGKDLNLPAEGAGEYKIQLYLSYEGANKVVFTKQ